MPKVLLVDEGPEFVEPIKRILASKRKDAEVLTAKSGQRALEILQSESIALLVVGTMLPGPVDGLSVVLMAAAHRPVAHLVVMSPSGLEEPLASPSGTFYGASLKGDGQNILDVIAGFFDRKEGYKGALAQLSADDVLWLMSLTARDAHLFMRSKEEMGRIVFEKGQLVDAAWGDARGEEAIVEILAQPGGSIVIEEPLDDVEVSINQPYADIIDDLRQQAKELAERREVEPVEITEEDLEDLLDPGEDTPVGPSLFTEEELAELELDDTALELAAGPGGFGSGSGGPPPTPGSGPPAGPVQPPLTPATLSTAIEAFTPDAIEQRLQRFFESVTTILDGVLAAAVFSTADGTMLGSRRLDGGPDPEELVGAYTEVIRAVTIGLDPDSPHVMIRDMVVHGGARVVLAVGLPHMQIATIVVQKRSANPSLSKAFLRNHARSLAQFLREGT